MTQTSSSEIFRVATAFEASRQTRTVEPDAADATRALGRDRFYDALAGRYGLPGSIFAEPERTSGPAPGSPSDVDPALLDLRAATASRTRGLAAFLRDAGRLDPVSADLMGYRLEGLPFAGDAIFAQSPVAIFSQILNRTRMGAGTVDLIAQQEDQIRYLVENNGDQRAIRGSKAVLTELRCLQIERSIYTQMDAGREGRARKSNGFWPFSATSDLVSFPSTAMALFTQR